MLPGPAVLHLFYIPGWPFAALIGLPIAVDILLFKKQVSMFVQWSLFSAVTILGPQVLVDSYYYGKPVAASLNIVLYNVFTSHGPDLYGTEPWTYYLLNGVLNMNIMFPAALVSLPVVYLASLTLGDTLVPSAGKRIPLIVSQVIDFNFITSV